MTTSHVELIIYNSPRSFSITYTAADHIVMSWTPLQV